jgi:hypothetical protein
MDVESRTPADADFTFVPRILSDNCRRLVESYHEVHGYASLPDNLWRAGAADFVNASDELRQMYRKASISRSARKSNASYALIASTLLSLEMLSINFLGWGARFPAARTKATKLLDTHLPAARALLMDVYLRQGNYARTRINTAILPPRSPFVGGETADVMADVSDDPARQNAPSSSDIH